MGGAIFACFAGAVMMYCTAALAQPDQITRGEAVTALKAALEKGSQAAVARLGRTD
jgi:hypothetical protein